MWEAAHLTGLGFKTMRNQLLSGQATEALEFGRQLPRSTSTNRSANTRFHLSALTVLSSRQTSPYFALTLMTKLRLKGQITSLCLEALIFL